MRIRLIVFVFVSFVFIPGYLFSQWTILPGFPGATSLVQSGSRLFATTWGNGIRYSDNNGESWKSYVNPDGSPSLVGHGFFQSLYLNGTDVVAGGYSELFVCQDNLNWSMPYHFNGPGIYGFAVTKDSVGTENLFTTNIFGVWRMEGSYSKWVKCDSVPIGAYKSVVTFATNKDKLFAGTGSDGVFLSTDQGASWNSISNGLSNSYITVLMLFDSNLYAGTNGGLSVSSDNGGNWETVIFDSTNIKVTSMAISGKGIFVGTAGGGIYLSLDNGLNWKQVNDGLSQLDIKLLYANNNYLFAQTANFSFRRPINEMIMHASNLGGSILEDFALEQNYPNPFNPITTIIFSIPKDDYVQLNIIDCLGREIATLVSEHLQAGKYKIPWSANHFSSGVYYYRLKTSNYSAVKKLILIH